MLSVFALTQMTFDQSWHEGCTH